MRLLRGYRLPMVLALPVGLVLGALAGLGLFAGSDEGMRTLGWLGYIVPLGAGVGAAGAAIAGLDAACAVALAARRRPVAQPSPALGPIAVGAGTSVALVVAVVGSTSVVLQGSWSELELWLIGSLVLGVIAAVAAVVVTAAAIRCRDARARPGPDGAAPPSDR